jgi:uncharacterized protein (TIGR04141 family)
MAVRSLTIYLLKKTDAPFEKLLVRAQELERYRLKPDSSFHGAFFVQNRPTIDASWLEFVQQGVEGDIRASRKSTSAVLFLKVDGRIFAITFGHGHHLLGEDGIEPHFGLRVAIQLVDAKELRSVDVRTIEQLTLYTRRQASRSTALGTFGLDINQDLLRAVTGVCKDASIASRVTGKDGLVLNGQLVFEDLGGLCSRLLGVFRRRRLPESFAWVGRLENVRDPHLLEQLQAALLQAFMEREFSRLHMAPPDIVDWEQLESFRYSAAGPSQSDLDPESFLDSKRGVLTLQSLAQHRILAYDTRSQEPFDAWPALKCIVFEHELQGRLYVLSGGLWYQVAKDLVEEVHRDLARIKRARLGFPPARVGEVEEDYNRRAARTMRCALLDRIPVSGRGPTTPMEVCDLLSPAGCLIHVKRHLRSATLSHLIAQGVNSAEALLGDREFRKKARAEVTGAFRRFFPDAPSARDMEVTYAVIARHNPEFPRNLPFFSQLSLTRAAERLRRQGVTVSVQEIPAQ